MEHCYPQVTSPFSHFTTGAGPGTVNGYNSRLPRILFYPPFFIAGLACMNATALPQTEKNDMDHITNFLNKIFFLFNSRFRKTN
jgi:hypothetical protein